MITKDGGFGSRRYGVEFLPVAPTVLALWVFLRHLRCMDEMRRRSR